MSASDHQLTSLPAGPMSASLIGRLGSSAFRPSAAAVSMWPTGSCFSSESAPGPFHHGIRGRGGTILGSALPSDERQVQADIRTRLIHRPARDIIPPPGGARVSSYPCLILPSFMRPPRLVPGSTGTRYRRPRYGAGSRPTGAPAPRSPSSSRAAWRSSWPTP
jgi:hypothetical protein